MNKQLSTRELEMLSAYLDGQLNARQLARLEARLDKNPELRVVLSELRHTRTLLRVVPKLRVPRNFTVTPEMVGMQQRPVVQPYPFFRLASTIASLLFVVVVVFDLIAGSSQYASVREAPMIKAVEQPAEGAAPQEKMMEMPAAEPEVMVQELPEEMIEGAEDVVAAEAEISVEAAVESEAPSGDQASIPSREVDEAEQPAAESMMVVEGTPVAEEAPLMMEAPLPESEILVGVEPTPQILAGEAAIEEVVEETLSKNAIPESMDDTGPASLTETESQDETVGRVYRADWIFLRYVEIGLAAIAIVAGGLTLYFRYRK